METLALRLAHTAQIYPQQIAAVDEHHSLNFQQLNAYVDSLTNQLNQLIQPGEHVAVLLPRGCDYLACAFAIWRAGGVYLPLDIAWPTARIKDILQYSHTKVLIEWNESTKKVVFNIQDNNNNQPLPAPGTPAYIIHTSGTTGKPKGVVVTHESLLHLVDNHQQEIYQPNQLLHASIAMNASFCFDSSLERLALTALGYCVHIISDSTRTSPALLIHYLKENAITNIDFVPSHLKILLHADLIKNASHLRLVIVGGEAIDTELWNRLAHTPIKFYNVYGPTENTINTTFCAIHADAAEPHIGKPFADVQCLIVDSELQSCSAGEAGELLVSGSHLAQGYYNAPIQTQIAFITLNGQRFYRTGDKVKQNSQGNLIFLGRIDDQIKINGYRIELTEIHRQLSLLPLIRFAAITPINKNNHQALLASVVLENSNAKTSFIELADLLRQILPEYMVPNCWQQLDELPLTDNLKLDHRALIQHWEQAQNTQSQIAEFTESLSPMEKKISQAWSLVLNKSTPAPDAHFFASGGNSLSAMKLIIELEKITGVTVELSGIFKYPTIRKMAVWLQEKTGIKA